MNSPRSTLRAITWYHSFSSVRSAAPTKGDSGRTVSMASYARRSGSAANRKIDVTKDVSSAAANYSAGERVLYFVVLISDSRSAMCQKAVVGAWVPKQCGCLGHC